MPVPHLPRRPAAESGKRLKTMDEGNGGPAATTAAELYRIRSDERLEFLEQHGLSPQDALLAFSTVESWMQSGARREIRRLGAVAEETGSPSAFHEWFEGRPAADLAAAFMKAGIRRTDLAAAYAVCELRDEFRAACNLAFLRRRIPDWSTVEVSPGDFYEGEPAEYDFAVDAETWPVY